MNNNYDIYFATNRLAISSAPIDGITTTISPEDVSSAEELCQLLNIHANIAIITPSPAQAFDTIASLFTHVTAAGGVTMNDREEILMIYRNGRWDLPKGHWEQGETIEECAIREVEEETGTKELAIGEKICTTIHIYKMRGKWEIKETHWFEMQTLCNTPLTPQREEGIMDVKWHKKGAIQHFIHNSYPTIQQVVRCAKIT